MENLLGAIQKLSESTEFLSAIAGGLVGAIAGGIASYLIQIKVIREARKNALLEQKKIHSGLANSLIYKIVRIHSSIISIQRHFDQCFEIADSKGLSGDPWQMVVPFANFPDKVNFDAEEIGFVIGLKNDNFSNDLMNLDVIHNSLIDGVRTMSERREKLSMSVNPVSVEGSKISGVVSSQELLKLQPQIIGVNTLIQELRGRAIRDSEDAQRTLEIAEKVFKENKLITFSVAQKEDRQD